jgi:hypothetical protein
VAQDDPRGVTRSDYARVALAGIRIFNGAAGLVSPDGLVRRLGVAEAEGGTVHVTRMFGVRTVLLGLDLLSPIPEVRRHAVKLSVVVHASDTTSAALAGLTRRMPAKTAVLATAISAVNTALAVAANREA